MDSVSTIGPSSCLGPLRSVGSCQLDSGDSSGSGGVADSILTRRYFSCSGVPSAPLMVRHLGHSLGGSYRRGCRFRPLVARGSGAVHKRHGVRSSVLSPQISNFTVAVFVDNSTAISYLSNQGGTRSPLNSIAQRILRWAKSLPVVLAPQFIMGRNNVLADSLSRPNQILGSAWNLKTEIFQVLRKRWPVAIELFASSLDHQCYSYFSPFHNPNALGTDALLQNWNGWQEYALPPWSLIPAVLKKLRSSSRVLLTIIAPYWPQRLVSGASGCSGGRSVPSSLVLRPPETTALPSSSSGVSGLSPCVETIQRFARS